MNMDTTPTMKTTGVISPAYWLLSYHDLLQLSTVWAEEEMHQVGQKTPYSSSGQHWPPRVVELQEWSRAHWKSYSTLFYWHE